MSDRVTLRSPRGTLVYEDTRDHFENGLLRLIGFDRATFDRWLAEAEDAATGSTLERLAHGFARVRPPVGKGPTSDVVDPGPGGERGEAWHEAIAESPAYGVARATDRSIAWLVRHEGGRAVRETAPPVYEESYFEGDPKAAGGYGKYAEQAGWRLEKAARQLREIREATGLVGGRALDLGSGYGYFRRALEDGGFAHDGIEISAHARRVAEGLYGFATLPGILEDHAAVLAGTYDLITLWDVIEHVADPIALFRDIARCLRPGGFVALKTPNIDCPEAELFGPYYHSLKREHLVYFSASSLTAAAAAAGLSARVVTSVSHLLTGFVGEAQASSWAGACRGADLVAYYCNDSARK